MTVDVIVPIFNNYQAVRRCLDSVLAFPQLTRFELVVVDDASIEPEVVSLLDDLASAGRVTLLRNAVNQGFVHSANRGMGLHEDRDVLLLNSDTEVANDWLDRLRACAYREPAVGTVTPFSNNATICSFPMLCADNPLPVGMGVPELDALFAELLSGQSVVIPTAVGFCMYIRRGCIRQVGLFDEAGFGRGYGEENDFCRRAIKAGWHNLLCADTYVYHAGSVSFGSEREELIERSTPILNALYPDYLEEVRAFIRNDPLAPLRRVVEIELVRRHQASRRVALVSMSAGNQTDAVFVCRTPQAMSRLAVGGDRPVQLHVLHDLAGGVEHWCRDYCRADTSRVNLILKPYCRGHAAGEGLMLFADIDDAEPIGLWLFASPFEVTAVSHPEYVGALKEIVAQYGVGAILVSSLIGHTLDVFLTGLPTVFIAHDYFPSCPAINLYYDGVCRQCDDDRLADCLKNNPDFNPFLLYPAQARLAVRKAFLEIIASNSVMVVVPSRIVWQHLSHLFPQINQAPWIAIPHGVDDTLTPLNFPPVTTREKLRVVVLGMLSVSKGMRLLDEALDRLAVFAEIYLVGAMEVGEIFLDRPGVHVVSSYKLGELQNLLQSIRPDVGILLSIWPETFSYTLTELICMGVPPLTTRLGAFAERLIDFETGFLIEPTAEALVARLADLNINRDLLARVRANLAGLPRRSAANMVADYHRLLVLEDVPDPLTIAALDTKPGPLEILAIRQAVNLTLMWKRIKSLELQLLMNKQARTASDARGLRRQAEDVQLAEKEACIHELQAEVERLRTQVTDIFASTSWRVSAPVRWLGKLRLKLAGRPVGASVPVVEALPPDISVELPEDWRQSAYRTYREALVAERPALESRLAVLPHQPLLSVLVPTYETEPAMLAAMLDSVLAQWYPHWELCIADDGSRGPWVRETLERYAAADSRIRLSFIATNLGVASASNRALAMARGEFVMLLDHDDMLEPHALLRFAEAVVHDDPDLFYGDEVLVAADGTTVQWFVFRPAFSPEYLRAHPYIVHPVGFRRRLLVELGGFDESLRISQDYDLILRVAERARTVVHVPEILYRWRLHGESAGHQQMSRVMETSKAVLQRHLQRSGEAGTVADGAAFNFFETRYPLRENLRVAIVIPTHNRHDLVLQCIASIEATAGEVDYDIFLIDHTSDDPESLRCFDDLQSRIGGVLRYAGTFNFSAINNWAIRQLGDRYTHYLFCNNDIEAESAGWLQRMLELGQKPGIGIVGAKLYYGDRRTLQHAGICVGAYGVAENLGREWRLPSDRFEAGYLGSLIANHEVAAVTAACLLIGREVFDRIGGFAEDLAVGYGDVDLCLRTNQAGYRVVLCPAATLVHHESLTRGPSTGASHPEDTKRFALRWAALIAQGDPCYNPNLALDSTTWAIQVPIRFNPDFRRRVARRGAGGMLHVSSAS